jgi:hypothetical protein
MPGLVRCGNCSELLAEPSDLPEAQRRPCPHCGAKHRTFEKNLAATVAVSADVVVAVSAASARAGTGYPTGSIARLEDAGFDLQWLRLSEGGAWMVRVFDRQGTWIDGSIQDDPQEALLAVCERLLPPQKPSE